MLQIASLNSGSNGNCYYIGNQQEAVLIDAGISCREIESRLKRLALSIKKVKAISITHEHLDHIKGVSVLSKKYQIPVYISEATHRESRLRLKENLVHPISDKAITQIGTLRVSAFSTVHDAADPHCFMISEGDVNVSVVTDIGVVTEAVINHFRNSHVAILEANYDAELLETGPYPLALKNRIRNGKGHLSNAQALDLFLHHRPDYMTHLFLGHISKHNNSTAIVENTFRPLAGNVEVVIASRYRETKVYTLDGVGQNTRVQPQLTLF
jgi:phosphoribosyl 1,2-cyclic phosphodiesterase